MTGVFKNENVEYEEAKEDTCDGVVNDVVDYNMSEGEDAWDDVDYDYGHDDVDNLDQASHETRSEVHL